jgi:hypothetical protein
MGLYGPKIKIFFYDILFYIKHFVLFLPKVFNINYYIKHYQVKTSNDIKLAIYLHFDKKFYIHIIKEKTNKLALSDGFANIYDAKFELDRIRKEYLD